MKFTIQRDLLVKAIKEVYSAVSNKPVIPILTGIHFVLDQSGLTLTGSDTNISIQTYIPFEMDGNVVVEIKETGSIVLPAKMLFEIVKKFPGDTVKIEVKEQLQAVIRSGKSKFHLNGLDAEEFPRLPQIEGDSDFQVSSKLLKKVISQTAFAASTSEMRPVLTGVNWTLENGELICIATDSHRLAKRKIDVNVNSFDSSSVTIPGKSLVELSKLLNDSEEQVEVMLAETQALFKTGRLLFYSRLLDGNYPDTSRLIPADFKTNVRINTKEFIGSIDRASLVSKEGKNNVVKLAIAHDELLKVSCDASQVGKVIEEVTAESLEGEDLTISFNSKFMMDALKASEQKEMNLQFSGIMKPFVLRPEGDSNLIQLILPVRTY